MAPALYHGLDALGLPVVCIESRQAYQALKSLATHKTDRNDARGLAHLARTGFYKPVHVKSLSAHAVRALIVARKKLVGQRVTLENQIRGLAVVFGVRLPRGLSRGFASQVINGSGGVAGLSGAMRGLLAARNAVLEAKDAGDESPNMGPERHTRFARPDRNRPARTYHWRLACGIDEGLGHGRDDTAAEIEEQEAQGPERGLDPAPEDPQIQHVARNMGDATV
jgi:transposase